MRKAYVVLGSVLLAAIAASGGEEIVLARRGAPAACTIAVPDAPSPCLNHAAEELSKYVKAMTGVALPVAESAAARGPKIRLVSGVALGRDSFRFSTDGDDFVIAGDDDRAVLFGVYDFLENDCGCDWLTHDQEIVPARDVVSVPRGLDRLRRPAFAIRENSFADVCHRLDFAAKLKLNGYLFARKWGWKDIHGGKPAEQFDPWLGKCHTFMHLLPPERYFKAHPEYYAEIDGKRRGEGRVQLCLTNPDVLRIATSNLLRRIAQKYPDVKIFGVSQSDCWGYCQCQECAAVDAREGSHAGTNIEFVNAIADAVAEKYPDVVIETLAYEYTRKPPKNVKPRPNVMICLCTDTCDFSRPLRETRFRFRGENDFVEDLKAWCAISRRVHIWDYTMNFRYKLHAFPNIYSLKPNLETFLDCGVTEVYEEGCSPSVHQAGVALKGYLIGHLLWDPRQRLEPLLDRFYAGYYGAAAPWMRRYMEELHAMSRERDETKHPLMMWGVIDSPALKTSFFERGAEYLAKAAEAVRDDPVRSRNVRWEMNANDYTRIMRANDICNHVLMRSGAYPVTPHLKELQSAARRILADWKAVPMSGKLSEEGGVIAASTNRMVRYASFDPAKARVGVFVHVPASELHGKLDNGATRLLFSDILAETGCVYRIAARIKADVRPDAKPDDEAFRMWVKNNPKTGRIYKIKDLKPGADGYGWYELRSTTDIDPSGFYIIEKGKAGAAALTLDIVRVAFADIPAEEACALEVETGSPLHVIDWPLTQAPVATFGNYTRGTVTPAGPITVADFYGREFEVPAGGALGSGETRRVKLPCGKGGLDAKGVWIATARFAGTDGVVFTNTARFGILDPHPVTPKIPYGRFRWGIHLHVARHAPADQPKTMDAAVRMGAKIVRIDDVFSGWILWDRKRKAYDWTKSDVLLNALEKRGLAVDAIVHENLGKFSTPEFYEAIAARYGERIDYYEVGNEWDLYRKDQMTPEQGVAVQKMAYTAMKKGNPKARVITNGWAVEDSNGHDNVTQKGFQEYFMREAKGYYDLHTMHLHFPFTDYVKRLDRFFALREREGVVAPWLLNETALSVRYRGEREVAENIWKKILYAWGKGARDYLWYNMRASSPDPGGSYGMVTHDYRPRLHYAAFSALATVFDGCTDIETLAAVGNRLVYRLHGPGRIVLAGWDAAARAPMPIPVATDAKSAFAVDIMGNNTPVSIKDGFAAWPLEATPSAFVLYGATRAAPDPVSLAACAVQAPRVIHVEPVRPGYGWDMALDKYGQVHENYPADPATAHRTWKGPNDLSGILLFKMDGSKTSAYIAVKDEKDTPGDRIEIWRDGTNVTHTLQFKRVRHGDNRTTYLAAWPDRKTCRVNVRFIDDDGFGGIDGWIDYVPFDAATPDVATWPLVRFE